MDTEEKPPAALTDDKIDDETVSRITQVSSKDENISPVLASVNPAEQESSPQDSEQLMKFPIDTCQSDKLDTTAHSASEDRPKTPPTRQYALEILGEKTMQELEGTKNLSIFACVEADLSVMPPSEIDGITSEPKAIVQDNNQASAKTVAKSSTMQELEGTKNLLTSACEEADLSVMPPSEIDGIASEPKAIVQDSNQASEKTVAKSSSPPIEEHNDANESESKPIDEENNPIGTGSSKMDEEKDILPQGEAKIIEEEGTHSAENKSKPSAASQGCIEQGVEASDSNVEMSSSIQSEGKLSNEKNAEALPKEVSEQACITSGKTDARKEAEANGTDNFSELTSTKPTKAKQSAPDITDESQDQAKSMKKEHRERLSKASTNMKKRLHYWKEGELMDERLDGWFLHLCKRDDGIIDKYWLTPTGLSLRSLSEIERFLKALPEVDGDEDRARKVAVNRNSKTQTQTKDKTPARVKAIKKKETNEDKTPAKVKAIEKKETKEDKTAAKAKAIKKNEAAPAKRKAKGSETPRASPKKAQKKEKNSSKKEIKKSEMPTTSAEKDSIKKKEKRVEVAKRKAKDSGSPKKVSRTVVSTDAVGDFDFSMTNAVQRASLPKTNRHKVAKKKQMTKHISDAKGVHGAKSAAQEKVKLQRISHKSTPTSARAIATQGSTPATAEPKPDLKRRKKLSSKKQAATQAAIVAKNKLGVPAVAESK